MSPIQKSVSTVRRRVAVSQALRGLGWALFVGLLVASAVLVADKLMPLTEVPLWAYGVIGGVGVVVGLALTLRGLPDQAAAAVLLDDKLGLKDKLGTALYAAELEEQNELTEQIAREADEAAQKARTLVHQAAPIAPGKVWNWTPIAAAVLLGVFFLMPEDAGDPLNQRARAEAEAEKQLLAEEGEEVIINTVEQTLKDLDEEGVDQKLAEGLPDELKDQLVSISDELKKNPGSAPEKLKEAESLISDAESRLGEQADVIEAAFNPLQNDASALDAGQTGPADQFTKAMNRGDFEAAKDAIDKMQEAIEKGKMSDEEKQQLQQQLENLAQQLQQQAQQAQQRQQQAQQNAQQQMAQQLQQSGMSQQQAQQMAQQMANATQQNQQGQQNQQQQGNQQQNGQQQAGQQNGQQQMTQQQMQQQLQQALQQQGMSQQQAQQQAQQMVQQMQQQMQQAQGQQQAGQMQQQLSQGLQQMAGQCNNPGGQQGQQPGQQGQPGQGQQGGQSAQQAINQMAQMQQQLQKMQMQQAQMQQAMNQLNQMQQQGSGNGAGGQPGQQWGDGEGGNPYGPQQAGYQHSAYAANDIQQGEGRVIASWLENGEVAPGEATVQFNASRTEAVNAAERAVTEDRVPRRYHETVKDYFQQLPEDPDAGRAPAAPR